MTALIVYGSDVATSTLSTASGLATGTGGTLQSKTTTAPNDSTSNYLEVNSLGGTGTDYASLPTPSGNGWLLDVTTLEGNTIAAGNWSGPVRINITTGTMTADLIVRFYKRSSGGSYTSIGSITFSAQSLTTTTTSYSFPSTSLSSMAFSTGDKLYIDFFVHPVSGGTWTGQGIKNVVTTSATQGDASNFAFTTPGYAASATTATKTLQTRLRLSTQVTKTLQSRVRLRVQQTKTLGVRFRERVTVTKTLVVRFLERTQVTKTLQSRTRIRVTKTVTLVSRFILQNASTTKTLVARFLERTQVTKTLPVRTLLRVQRTLVLQVRLVMTKYTKILQVRALLRVLSTKTLQARVILRTQITKSVQVRFIEQVTRTLTLQARARLRTLVSRTLQARVRMSTKLTKSIQVRLIERVTRTLVLQIRAKILTPPAIKTLTVRVRLMTPRLLSGKGVLWANGTGTASFDHFRWTEYPDPALSLAPILPRLGSTGASWNALTPANTTLGVDIGTDGINWTDITSGNGGSIPGFYAQPDPSIDGFAVNTSAAYTSTCRTGGVVAGWAFETANSRLVATGGTNGILAYTAVNRADVDFFADMDQSDAGGLVWRYVNQSNFYYLLIADTLASTGTKNTITLFKVASNVQIQIATSTISYSVGSGPNAYTVNFTRGTYHRFRVSMLSGVITVYVDGVSFLSYTDGAPLGAGLMGLYNNAGITGSRYYQLWMQPIGDYVSGTPTGDIVTGQFVYMRQRLGSTDPTVTPQVEDTTLYAFTPNIKSGVSIPAVTYNASFINKNFDDLVKQCNNFYWYIDQNKVFSFGGVGFNASPWILQSAPAGLVPIVDLEVNSNLELDVSNDLYRNRQTILGALGILTASATFIGDGNTRSFTLGYPLASTPTLLLNNIAQTIGLKGTSGSQWYWAYNDPVIEQDANLTVLQSSDELTVPNYSGLFDVTVTIDDTTEQANRADIEGGTGIVEAVEDHTGEGLTEDAAITLATQLLARYAIVGRTLIFSTSRDGLAIGQMLSIFLPEQGIVDGQFLITQVEITLQKNINDTQVWWYKVTASELPRQASWAKLVASGLGLN